MLISIITVNYNNVVGLKRTMSSVFEQTYKNIEYIIIDGGSTDGSKAYLQDHNQNIDYWVSEPDKGVYNAMNKGIKIASGEYVLFLNSGDHFYSKDALSFFQPFTLKENKKDILYGNIAVISKTERIKTYPKKLTVSYFIEETLPHPATLIKRDCFKGFFYDERLKIASDWKFFMIGICKLKFTYQYINEVISSFYLDGISSINSQLVSYERNQVLKEDFYWQVHIKELKEKFMQKFNNRKEE